MQRCVQKSTLTRSDEKRGIPSEAPAFTGYGSSVAINPQVAFAMPSQGFAFKRFTLDGSPELERHLTGVCADVGREIRALIPPARLAGLLLGGGYGRGEGGVLRTESGDQPYNDLEFYVLVRGGTPFTEARYRGALHAIGEKLSPAAGIDVEFKLLTLDKLRSATPSVFLHDLWMGHHRVIGDDSILTGWERQRDARDIPLHEATRLLMNRCSGLLFSAERLSREQFGAPEADFTNRNLAKAQLALGDVLLTASGQYHWSCRTRHERLQHLPTLGDEEWRRAILRHHAAGVAFKLRPFRSSGTRALLSQQHTELSSLAKRVWLWLENLRLGTAFTRPGDYAMSSINKCPETWGLRNRLVNLKAFGPATAVKSAGDRYPRERLLNALSLLLWEKDTLTDASLLHQVQRDLNSGERDLTGLVSAYGQIWHRFN